jgi:hypothetical protein
MTLDEFYAEFFGYRAADGTVMARTVFVLV